MKKILTILLLLLTSIAYAEPLPLSFRNINDDLSGIVSDEQSDILMNPAEITKINRWKFQMGIGNLLNRNELVNQLDNPAKPKSIINSSPVLSILGKQDSREFKEVWIGTIYTQHNSQQYGLGLNDDLNPNEPGVQQPGLSFVEISSFTETGSGLKIEKSTATNHHLNTESMKISVVYGWKLSEKTNLGFALNYSGNSSQEPNNYFYTRRLSTHTYKNVYTERSLYENEHNTNSNNFSLNAGITRKTRKNSELGISGGIAYLSNITENTGYRNSTTVENHNRFNRPYNYLDEMYSTGLDNDNDNNATDEDGIDGSPGNLPGIDDDGDGRIDEDPQNINYKDSGIGIPIFINYKSKISENIKVKAFLDSRLSLSFLNSNTSNFHMIENTLDENAILNDCYSLHSSTQTDTTGTKLSESLQLGFGYEAKITKKITFLNGIKIALNAYQSNSSWDKTEYFIIQKSTSPDLLEDAAVTRTSEQLVGGTGNIDSTEWILQVPLGIEFGSAEKFSLQLGMTWQARYLLVQSTYENKLYKNGNRTNYNIVYYMGMSFRLGNKMYLSMFNSFNEFTADALLRWHINLKGYF